MALIETITLMPILLTMFLGVCISTQSLRESTSLHSRCTKVVYHFMDLISIELNALLKLNPNAQTLRIKHQKAQAQLTAAIATGNAIRIANCERRLVEIEFAQAKLDNQQKNHLQNAERLRGEMQIHSQHIKNSIQLHSKPLNVRPDIPTDIAPMYIVINDSADLSLRKFQIAELDYLLFKQKHSCAASIEKRGFYYRATLVRGVHDTF